MTRKFALIVLWLASIAMPAICTAQVTYTLQTCTGTSSPCYLTIEGLEVAGGIYNVEFVGDSYDNIFSDTNLPAFWNNPTLAQQAGLELSRTFRSIGLADNFYSVDARICGPGRCPDGPNIPFGNADPDGNTISTCFVPGTPIATETNIVLCTFTLDRFDDIRLNYAVFTKVGTVPRPVSIDIRPRREHNRIDPNSQKNVSVAVLTTDEFDATQIDPQTVGFGPDGASEWHERVHVKDVDGDGDIDAVFHFCPSETGIQCGDTEATLTGETFAGDLFEGSDFIETVRCH